MSGELRKGSAGAIAAALLMVLALSLVLSVRQESQTFDEGDHLFAGLEYWRHGDFGRNPEHPPLAKLLAALPLLPMGLKEPPVLPIPFFKAQDMGNASQLLYTADADAILMRGRLVIACFSLGLGLLVFFAGREMFGATTGLLALGLFAFEPTVLAHGALVTTDMPLACLFFASMYSFYRYCRGPSATRLALCAVASGLTIVTKHSGIVVLPSLALLAVLQHFLPGAQRVEDGGANTRPTRPVVPLVAAVAIIIGFSYVILWAAYGFRYVARPDGMEIVPNLLAYSAGLGGSWKHGAILFFARHHLFPEAYLFGWTDILQIAGRRSAFLFGKLSMTSRWYFFPAVFLIKSSLALLTLLVLVPFARMAGRRREYLFLGVPAALFLLVAVGSGVNTGVRHLLPMYPFCIVLGSSAAVWMWRRGAPGRIVVGGLLVLSCLSSLHGFPDYLAYSNELFGEPSHSYRLVGDSGGDWGQGLKWLKVYVDKRPGEECWFDSYNPLVPPAYYGIPCKPLMTGFAQVAGIPSAPVPPVITGTVFLSATDAEGSFWGPGSLNPYATLWDRRPDATIENIILVYKGTFELPLLAAHSDDAAAVGMLMQHRVPEALSLAQEAAKLAPESARVNMVLGQTLMASGRVAEGGQALGKALHLAKTDHPEFQAEIAEEIEHPRRH